MSSPLHPAQMLFTKDHPLTSRLRMEFVERLDGVTKIYVDGPQEFADTDGTHVHGGLLTLLLDTVMGASALAGLTQMMPIATIKLTTNQIRKPRIGERLVCIAHQQSEVNSVSYEYGEIRSVETDELYATAVGTFMLGTTLNRAGGTQ